MKTLEKIYKNNYKRLITIFSVVVILMGTSAQLWADDETFNSGAYIIDMGDPSPTYDNGLKPYGLIYQLLVNHNVPVKWAINESKSKDGIDFSIGSDNYSGGPFIIAAEYVDGNVLSLLNSWGSDVDLVGPIGQSFTAPIYATINSWPEVLVNNDKPEIVAAYFVNAGVPTNFYDVGPPRDLDDCHDLFLMPHADPQDDWNNTDKTMLLNFMDNDKGYFYGACETVGNIEGELTSSFHFLSVEGLQTTHEHGDGNTNQYVFNNSYSGDPIMQFMGNFGNITDEGSERIYMPEKGDDWRPTTKLAIYQPNHPDADDNEASVLVYGPTKGDNNKGMVLYEAGHKVNKKGTIAQQVAGQRAFFNFILLAGIDKEIEVTSNIPDAIVSGSTINLSVTPTTGQSPYDYAWTSSCAGGSFGSPSNSSTTYTAPTTATPTTCVVSVVVTDNCGRFVIETKTVTVSPAGPDAVNDNATTPMNTPVDITEMTNDIVGDAALDPTSITFVGGTAPNPTTEGTFTVDATTGLVTFTPVNGFVGTATINYSVCDLNSLCDVATIIVIVSPVVGPTAVDDNTTTPINTPVDITALSNDTPGDAAIDPSSVSFVGGTEPDAGTEGTFTVHPTTGLVTFTPVNGYTGTVTIDYNVCDLNSLCDVATITVVISGSGPTAVDDNATTTINTAVDINALANDVQGTAALDPTSVSFVGGTEPNAGTEGTFTVDPVTGLVTFTPVNAYTGTVTIDYNVCDLNSLCDVATITVIIAVTGPTAVDDNANTSLNTPVDIDVLDNDTPGTAALDPTTVSFIGGTEPDAGTEGTFTVDPVTGLVTFTPVTGFSGSASIDYEVCDLNSLCSTATITVFISSGDDSDGDGCADEVDDYPNDPTRCFDIYYPANGNGTLAYEDLWPSKGDYDFNDLVVEYRFKTVMSGTNHIVETFADFTIRAFGAGFENGFGFQLANDNITDADILSVTGYDIQESYINLEANGIESGQSIPTFIVYDNAFNIMEHPGQGIGVNTEPWATYVEPVTLNMYISYTQSTYTYAQLDIPNFNPFIMVNLNRGTEVHLPNYEPTDLANEWQFGTWDDDSDESVGRYYKTSTNLPWVIHIPEPFAWPIEKQDIIWVHLKFALWAESGGTLFQDWYQNLSGYRNNSLIYDQP